MQKGQGVMDVAQYCTCGSILLPPIPLPASLFGLSSYGVGCSSFVPYAPAPDHHLRPAMSRRMLPGSSVHRPLNWTPSQTAHHPGGSSSKVSEAQRIWEGSILKHFVARGNDDWRGSSTDPRPRQHLRHHRFISQSPSVPFCLGMEIKYPRWLAGRHIDGRQVWRF